MANETVNETAVRYALANFWNIIAILSVTRTCEYKPRCIEPVTLPFTSLTDLFLLVNDVTFELSDRVCDTLAYIRFRWSVWCVCRRLKNNTDARVSVCAWTGLQRRAVSLCARIELLSRQFSPCPSSSDGYFVSSSSSNGWFDCEIYQTNDDLTDNFVINVFITGTK